MQIFVKQPGMDSIRIEAKSTDTVASIKEQLGLPKAAFWLGRQFLKNASTLEACGVQQGATINALQNNKVPGGFANRGQYQSAMKLQSGKIKVASAHPELHNQTQSVVMAESSQVQAKVQEVKEDVKELKGLLRGEEAPRAEGQSDKERIKELRLRKRVMDNELADLKEREANRISSEKKARSNEVTQAAQIADGSVSIVVDQLGLQGQSIAEQKADLLRKQAAQRKAFNENAKNQRAEERSIGKALQKAKVAPKSKAKGKAKARAKAMEEVVPPVKDAAEASTVAGAAKEAAPEDPAEEDSDEEEDCTEVAREVYDADPYKDAKVYKDKLYGNVVNIVIGDKSGKRLYEIKFEDGTEKDFLQEKVKRYLVADEAKAANEAFDVEQVVKDMGVQ